MADTISLLNQAENYLSGISEKVVYPENQNNWVDIYVASKGIKKAVKALYDHDWGYLIAISAYNTTDESGKPKIGLVYHFGDGVYQHSHYQCLTSKNTIHVRQHCQIKNLINFSTYPYWH
ncbi:MAG: hypothetical protein AB9907_04445 [Flexilinea sp.]